MANWRRKVTGSPTQNCSLAGMEVWEMTWADPDSQTDHHHHDQPQPDTRQDRTDQKRHSTAQHITAQHNMLIDRQSDEMHTLAGREQSGAATRETDQAKITSGMT